MLVLTQLFFNLELSVTRIKILAVVYTYFVNSAKKIFKIYNLIINLVENYHFLIKKQNINIIIYFGC